MKTDGQIRFGLLGPVEATLNGEPVALGGTKQRALLAALLLAHGETLSVDRLAEALWGEEPAATAPKTLQVHVSRLRRDLPGLQIHTRAPGYALEVEPGALDLDRFEALADEGRQLLAAGDAAGAADRLRSALAIWRGPALADVALEPVADQAVPRLEDERLAATEDRIEADLACGRHAEVVGELRALAKDEPLRERLWALLMIALCRSGRQGDALSAYQDAPRELVEQLGIEPGPRLRELEQQVLEQDPALDAPPAKRPGGSPVARRTRRVALAAAIAGLLVAAAVAAAVVAGGDDKPARKPRSLRVASDSVARIDIPSGRVERVVHVGRSPDQLTVTRTGVWVGNKDDRTVTRIDRRDGHVDTVKGLPGVYDVASTPLGGVFVSSFERYVWFLSEQTLTPRRVVKLPGQAEALVAGAGSLWILSPSTERGVGGDEVVRLDGTTNRITQRVRVGTTPLFESFGYGRLWVSNYDGDTVSVVEPGKAHAKTVVVGDGPLGIAAGEGGVWVTHFGERELWRIDPVSLKVVARIPIGNGTLSVAAGGGSVWVTNREDGTVQQIDPVKNRVKRTLRLGLAPYGVEIAGDKLWVTFNRE